MNNTQLQEQLEKPAATEFGAMLQAKRVEQAAQAKKMADFEEAEEARLWEEARTERAKMGAL